MGFGKSSALFGVLAVLSIVAIGFSLSGDDGTSGPIVRILSNVIGEPTSIETPMEFRSAGVFELHESSIRLLLSIIAISLAITAGYLAVMASKEERNSLWYAIGAFGGFTAIGEINYAAAAVFGLVVVALVMRSRKWKMTVA